METEKKAGKIRSFIKLIIFLCVFGLIGILMINLYIIQSTQKYILSEKTMSDSDFDCALVLGARVYSSGKLSPMLEDRVLTGIELYQNGTVPKLLLSGDHGRKNYDEVNAMKRYALDKKIPQQDIFMDHAGFSTYESMYRARDVFQVKRTIIVTQKFHLNRAIFIARALGINTYGIAADKREYQNQWYNELRESLARVKDFINVFIRPKPTYLGDVIPISKNGLLTQDKKSQ
ncbi:MAG: YdcF family protein [Clostridiales bacterium]|nr:YdcF family protein [Clostridiales bacterium]